MEYLVIKRVFRKVVWSRLMVGHTHEDIDAIFGRIWKHMRNMHVLTPQQYKKVLMYCLKRKRPEQFLDVTDIIVIPNYDLYFDTSIDPKFGSYVKGFLCVLIITILSFLYALISILFLANLILK
jgi:hypothetical protein